MNSTETVQPVTSQLAWRANGGRSDLPGWLDVLLQSSEDCYVEPRQVGAELTDGVVLSSLIDSPFATLASVRSQIDDQDDPNGHTTAAIRCYNALFSELKAKNAIYPVRMWNFVPRINEPIDDQLNYYMQFNVGRHEALAKWYGSPTELKQLVATASGVGHGGSELVIHVLALKSKPGWSVENPRQVPAYNYSRRFGPASPSFARATLANVPHVDNRDMTWLMVGGTASVVGEESRHVGQLSRQIDETLDNLSSLVQQAHLKAPESAQATNGSPRAALSSLSSIRVYYVRANDLSPIQKSVLASFPHIKECEFLQTSLCRPELLVEIEGAGVLTKAPSDATSNGSSQ